MFSEKRRKDRTHCRPGHRHYGMEFFANQALNTWIMKQEIVNTNSHRNNMRGFWLTLFFLLPLLSSCKIIGDIFEAGVWTGVLLVVVVVGLIIFVVARLLGGGGNS